MTKVLDRLERAGYITRAADPSDRRRITITADPDGLARLAAHYAPMGEKISRYLAESSTADLTAVLAFMRAGRQAADEEIARIRRQGIRHATRRSRHRPPPADPQATDAS